MYSLYLFVLFESSQNDSWYCRSGEIFANQFDAYNPLIFLYRIYNAIPFKHCHQGFFSFSLVNINAGSISIIESSN